MEPLPGESFLIAQFREFYAEVMRLKDKVERGAWVFAEGDEAAAEGARSEAPAAADRSAVELRAAVPPGAGPPEAVPPGAGPPEAVPPGAVPPGAGDPGAGMAPSAVWQTLLTLLERQALAARRRGGEFAVDVFGRAQYAMAALADEIFLHTDWGGRESWRSHLLEARLFRSHRAGEQVFERIERLLDKQDAAFSDLARVYLMTLALGFQGKYRDREDGAVALAAYRRRLFGLLHHGDPQVLRGHEHLFPGAYAATLDQGTGGRLPHLKPWLWGFAALIVLWVALSYPVWDRLVSDLEPLLEQILEPR